MTVALIAKLIHKLLDCTAWLQSPKHNPLSCTLNLAPKLAFMLLMQVTHAFPAVLEKLELHAFDLCKMIDPFVRYEPSTPRDLKRHLHSIEEKIIESLAWERGSSFYPLLVLAFDSKANRQPSGNPEGKWQNLRLLMCCKSIHCRTKQSGALVQHLQ